MNREFSKRLVSLGLTVVLAVSSNLLSGGIAVSADTAEESAPIVQTDTVSTSTDYNEYISNFNNFSAASGGLVLNAADAVVSGDAVVKEANGKTAVLWQKGTGTAEWTVTVPTDSYYNIKLEYSAVESGVDYVFGLKIDGKTPFGEAELLSFPRLWKNASDEVRVDNIGNQLTPEQTEVKEYGKTLARSTTGVTVDPYAFYLSAGTHTVSISNPEQAVAVASLELSAPEKIESYKEVSKDYKISDNNVETIVIQGEKASLKSASSLIPKSDNSDAGVTPNDVMLTKLNYIGGTSWQEAGQFLQWDFTAQKSGYYKLGFRYRQSDVINAESWRWLKIDGKTPFTEAKGIRFPYCAKWSFFEWKNGEEPYYIWLDKGEHTLTLEVTMGVMSEYFYRLSDIVDKLGNKYIDIVKITGATPDANLDYELFRQIPDLNDTFKECREQLIVLAEDLEQFTGKRSSQYIAALNNMNRVLKIMCDSPYMAHQYVTDYYTNYSSLSSWLYDMKKMPLYIDTIQLAPVGEEFKNKDASFFKKLVYGIERLVVSFADDYIIEAKTSDENKTSLKLWVNWGRDQATALDTLIRDSFTAETGIPVKVQITNASLINGLLSGNFPDMALHLTRTEPVNLGIRGALTDLSEFDDIDEILERFQPDAQIPYCYDGELYALPDTQSFYMMFYRSDILESLGLKVPTTWDEFLYTSAIIQRNNMNVYIPYTMITAATTVNAGIGSLNLFPTLMGQNGLSIYNEELNATKLTGIDEISVFDFWTTLYTDYEYQKEADFYNRLRVGVMPLGIAPYSTYLTLYSAAPEIKGRWSVACVPGTKGGNDSVAGAGTGCAILKKSPNQEEAWQFLKWWTSAETQTRYSNNVESLLGMLGRQTTANVEALKALSWDKNDLEIILSQWSKVKEVPELPGSYYLSRAIDQAYWSVLNDNVNAKDAITKWSQVADAEINRKIEEYK